MMHPLRMASPHHRSSNHHRRTARSPHAGHCRRICHAANQLPKIILGVKLADGIGLSDRKLNPVPPDPGDPGHHQERFGDSSIGIVRYLFSRLRVVTKESPILEALLGILQIQQHPEEWNLNNCSYW